MDILDYKYIPEDDLVNILYSIEPEHIFNFCRINKTTDKICKKISWKKYINGDQSIYDRLLITTAENGSENIFKHLIKNKDKYGIIINGMAIKLCFRLAVINGYDQLADYIWKIVKPDNYRLQRAKYQLLLEQLIQSGKLKKSIKFIEDIIEIYDADNLSKDISYIINYSLNKSPDYEFMKKLINMAESKFGQIYKVNRYIIFYEACRESDMNIVIEMLSEPVEFNPKLVIWGLLSCPSRIALKLLKKKYPLYDKYISVRQIMNGDIILRNIDILYDLINRLSKNDASKVLLFSPSVFKPYEFINMLNDEGLCYNYIDLIKIIDILNKRLENYYVKILEEEAPLCEL